MKTKMSKTKKQILALGMLALGGLTFGSLSFVPYLLRHWSTIQYEVVNFKSEFDQNEKKFTLGFELSDLDAYKLKYQPLQVKLYSDSNGKSMVSEHTAHYDDFSRSWKLDVDASQLTPGSRYYIGIDYKEGKNRFGAKKIVGFSKNVADFINVPAAVKSINFGKIDTGSAAVKVDFSDDIKSLEGKKVALEYYYLPKGQKVAAKNQIVTTYVDLTTVKEGTADFQLNNLLPDADYYVSGVKLISDGQTPRELTSGEQENIQLSEGTFFNTKIIDLKVNQMSATDELDLGKFILLTFDKKTNPELTKVNNMPVEISYINRTSSEHEIKVIRTRLIDNVISFHLNRANNHLLPLGSSFEIAQIKIAGANVEFAKGVSNVFYSQNGVVAIKSKTSGTTANVEATFASQDDISGLIANVDLSPLAENKVSANIVPLENNLYKATFNIIGLTNKTVYNINEISLNKLPINTVFPGNEFDYRKFNFEDGVERSFLTGLNDLSVFIKAAPEVETNLVTYSFGFGPKSNYLNSKQLRLAYHLEGDGHIYYSQVATAAGNSVKFKLNEFLPGRKYKLDNVEIVGEQDINVVIDGDKTDATFYTRAAVSDIQFEDIGETNAKVKVFIQSDLEQWQKIKDSEDGKVTLIYSAGAHNSLVLSIDTIFKPSSLTKVKDGFEIEFNLSGLNRKTDYYIDNLIFSNSSANSLFSGDGILALDKYFITKFESSSPLTINTYNISQETATVEIQFNPDTDSFLDNHKFRLVLKKNDSDLDEISSDKIDSKTDVDDDSFVSEVKSSAIRFNLKGLQAGSKYTIVNLQAIPDSRLSERDASQFAKLKFNFTNSSVSSSNYFYTSADITSIEHTSTSEQTAQITVHLESQDPKLTYNLSNPSLAYLNKTTKILEFVQGRYEPARKVFIFDLGNTTHPLQKVTDYQIQRVIVNQHPIPFSKTFDENNKNFSTSAKTAQIVGVQQVGRYTNKIKVVLNFSGNDDYLNGEQLSVQLNQHNGSEHVRATATVNNSSAEFEFTGLTHLGTQYEIGQITHISNNHGRTANINFGYDNSSKQKKDKLYTLGEVNNFTYNTHKEVDRATVTVSFTDVERFFNQNSLTKTTRTAILKYHDDNGNPFSAMASISNGQATFNLDHLKEFTKYTIQSLEINQIGNITLSSNAESHKDFYTKVGHISLNDAIYVNKSPTNTEATLVFETGDKKVIEGKTINVVVSPDTSHSSTGDKHASGRIEFDAQANRYQAKLNFTGLVSGIRYNLNTLTITHTQEDPSANPNTSAIVDTVKINNEHKNTFSTIGVIKNISLVGNPSDKQATIKVDFQGDLNDSVAGFKDRSATLIYRNTSTNQLVSNVQTIQNNSANFILSNLIKQQEYQFVSLKLDGIQDVQLDSTKAEEQVNHVKTFTTAFASIEIKDIQQKVENDKTVVSIFFDSSVDEVAINNYMATLKYTPKVGGVKQSSSPVVISNFKAVFNLTGLQEVSTFDINSVEITKPTNSGHASSASGPITTPPSATFSSLLNGNQSNKKVFYSAPKITEITPNVHDDSANLTIKVKQPENTYTGNSVNALLVFKSKRTGTTNAKLIQGKENAISGEEKTFTFDLTGLDKLTTYEIEELRLNGNVIKFSNDINAHVEKKDFQTTATYVETPSFIQTVKKKNEVAANISFDPVKDWYLIGNKISFQTTANGKTKEFETTVGSDGLAKLDITSDAITSGSNAFVVGPGENINFNTIRVINEAHTEGLTKNLDSMINHTKFINDDSGSRTPVTFVLKSKDLITSVVNRVVNSNSAQITLKLATSDQLTGKLTLNYLNKQTGIVQHVEAQVPQSNTNGNVEFSITGTRNIQNLVEYQLQNVEANGEIIGFDTDTITIEQRQFRPLPNSVTVKSIITKYDPIAKTAVARVEFDDTARQFLAGKKVKLLYHPLLQSISSQQLEATKGANGTTEALIRPDGTVEFKLDGTLVHPSGNGNITIDNIPGRAPGGSSTTNTNSNLNSYSNISFNNNAGTLIDGIKYRFTAVEVLDSGINGFRTTLNLTHSTDDTFSTLPISTYAYQVKTDEQLDKVVTTIEAFYLTNEPLQENAETAQKFKINLYNPTNKSVVEAQAVAFTSSEHSIAPLHLMAGSASTTTGQQYFWKVLYKVDLEKASLYQIVSTSYDGKDIDLSRYTNEHSGQSVDNQLKQYFTTPGTKTKVVGIDYGLIPSDDSATIKVQLDDVDNFVGKNNLQLKLSYQQKAGTGMPTGRNAVAPILTVDSTSITQDGLATFDIQHLSRASRYEITKIELVGHEAIGTGEGLKIETVASGSQQASNLTFNASTTNAPNQTLFATRNGITNISFSQNSTIEGQGILTLTFGTTGNQVDNDKGILTFIDETTGLTSQQEILANSNYDDTGTFNRTNNRISFLLTNLRKIGTYKIQKVSIHGLNYFVNHGVVDTFNTVPKIVKITNVEYSDLQSILTSDNKLAGTGKIKVTFDGLESYLVDQTLSFTLNSGSLTKTIVGKVQKDVDSNPYVELMLTKDNFASTNMQPAQIVVGKTWKISNITIPNKVVTATVKEPNTTLSSLTFIPTGPALVGSGQGLTPLKPFTLPGYFSNISLENSNKNSSSTISLKTVTFSGNISQFDGKQVVVELDSHPGYQYFATARVNRQTLTFSGLNLDRLPSLHEHHVKSIKIDGVSYPISPSTTSTNVAYTNVEHFKVTRFEWDEVNSTHDTTKLKVIFDPKDKWLLNKKVELKYKALLGSDHTDKILSDNNLHKEIIDNGHGQLEADFDVPVNGTVNTTDSFNFAQHYEFIGVELASSDFDLRQFHKYNQTKVPTALYDPSLGLNTNAVRFFTYFSEPQIQSSSITDITNTKGKLDTFQATVSISFTNHEAIAGETASTWDVQFFNHIRSNAVLEGDIDPGTQFKIINKRWNAKTNQFQFEIYGDLKPLIDNFNQINIANFDANRANNFYMKVSYKYFDNPSRTILKNKNLVDKIYNGTFLDTAFPKKYVEVTKIEGKQTTPYDYGIEIEIYDPFDIVKTTDSFTHEQTYQKLYETIYNNGSASDGTKGIGYNYFNGSTWYDKNKTRLANVKQLDVSQGNYRWTIDSREEFSFGLRLASIDKLKQSMLDLSTVNILNKGTVGGPVTKVPSPLYKDSHFRPKVQIVNASNTQEIEKLPELNDTDNYVSVFGIWNYDIQTHRYVTNNTKYKRIWLNISPGTSNSLAGKVIVLDLSKFYFDKTGDHDFKMIVPQNDDELQKVFVMPSSENHFNAFWGTYTNNWSAADAKDKTGPIRLTIESRSFFDVRHVAGFDYPLRSQYDELQTTLDNNTILGPSPFLAPFQHNTETISYYNVQQGNSIDNKIRIYNYGDTQASDAETTWKEKVERQVPNLGKVISYTDKYILNNYQFPFGISGASYDPETEHLTVTFDWARNSNSDRKNITTVMQHKAYATYVDNDGNMYYFGKVDGDGASFDKDLTSNNNSIIFSIKQPLYATNQNPTPNRRLYFVGILVQPYSNEDPSNTIINIHVNNDKPNGRWTNPIARYNVDAYRKVIVVPGVLDYTKAITVSRTYSVPILTKAAQDQITQSIIYK